LRNYFTLIRKVGTLWKRGGGFFGSWQQRFVVLTNAGLVYFKVDEMKKEEDLEPQNFKPLNDFVIAEADMQEAKKQWAFKVLFCKGTMLQKDLLLAAPTEQDMKEWIKAFRLHQIDTLEARSKFLEKKLERVGVLVPRATVLIEQNQVIGIGGMVSQATLGRGDLENKGKDVIIEESGSNDESESSEEEKKEQD